MVQSWSDTQIVAVVATGSTSGNAQVLQNGVVSNAVPFAVNSLHIASVTPNSGGPGTSVAIIGTGFGSSQGSGQAWLGSITGQVVTWGNTQVVAVVAPNAVSGIAKIEQNGVWSNAISFTVPISGANTLTLIPSMLNLVVGETHTIQALNASSQPVTGLTWVSSNPKVVSLSIDDPPILTALAPGNVTITAGSASADVTVSYATLAPGTVIWSNPGDGSGVQKIIPAVPSSTGVADIFALQADGNVQAITSDGVVAWTANVGNIGNPLGRAIDKRIVPDFQGGLVVVDPGVEQWQSDGTVVSSGSVQKLDGMTGQAYPAYNIPNTYIPGVGPSLPVAVHTDGTIFTVNGDSLVGVDPSTGSQKFSIPMIHSTYTLTYTNGPCTNSTTDSVPDPSGLVIAGDGYAYVVYSYSIESTIYSPDSPTANCFWGADSTDHIESHMRLLRVGTDGSFSEIALGDWTQDHTATFTPTDQYGSYEDVETQSGAIPSDVWPKLITNGDQGVLLSLLVGTASYYSYSDVIYTLNWPYKTCPPSECGWYTVVTVAANSVPDVTAVNLLTITGGSVTSNVTLPSQFQWVEPVLQAQDGTFFGIVEYDWDWNDDFLASFDRSGNFKWSKPGYYAQIATADGGVIAQNYSSGQSVTFDTNGNAAGQGALSGTPSWQGFMYSVAGDPVAERTIPTLAFLQADLSHVAGGNVSNSTAPPWKENPFSLRIVPHEDSGVKGHPERYIHYELKKLDGVHDPDTDWYITEHQTLWSLADKDGMSTDKMTWDFHDHLACLDSIGCGWSHQTFTISPNPGKCATPSYGNPGNTKCQTNGGTIVVRNPPNDPQGDVGILWLSVEFQGITVDEYYHWPGVPYCGTPTCE